MDDTTKEALDTLRSIITLPDQRDLGFPVDVVEKALEATEKERDEALAKVAELSKKVGGLEEVRQAAAVLLRLGVGDFVYHVRDTENVRDTTPKGASTWDHPDVKAWSAACETMRKITKHTAGEGQQKEST